MYVVCAKLFLALISCNNHDCLLTLFSLFIHLPIQSSKHPSSTHSISNTTYKWLKKKIKPLPNRKFLFYFHPPDPQLLPPEVTAVTRFLCVLPEVFHTHTHTNTTSLDFSTWKRSNEGAMQFEKFHFCIPSVHI